MSICGARLRNTSKNLTCERKEFLFNRPMFVNYFQCKDLKRSEVTEFRVLDVLESVYLKPWKIIVHCSTTIEFGRNYRSGNGTQLNSTLL